MATTECPVCTMDMTSADKLACGHYTHPVCVKRAADVLQDYLAEAGYPSQKYAHCPICRAELTDILVKPATWYGEITLTASQIAELLGILETEEGIIAAESVPEYIKQQMVNAHPEEQRLFTIKAATILWLTKGTEFPSTMQIRQVKDSKTGRFGQRVLF